MKYCKFLELYRKYTKGNETPELMHLWVGLHVLAGAAEKRLWVNRGFFNIYLNLYIILLAPPGVCAKSMSMDLGHRMLREAGFNTLDGSVLKEQIVIEMLEAQKEFHTDEGVFMHCSLSYSSDELNVLLTSGIEMVKFLTDIWGKNDLYTYKTKKSGQYEVPYPYFNLIAAAVPDWFGPAVASDMTSTGFLARCIIIYESQKRCKEPSPKVTIEQQEARSAALDILLSIAEMYGECTLSDEADTFYNDWYNKQDIPVNEDPRMIGYLERKNKVFVLKLAALMALGDERQCIEKLDIERALHLFKWAEEKMRMAFIIAGGSRLAPHIHRVMSILDNSEDGSMSLKELVRMMFTDLTPQDIISILRMLEDMGIAEIHFQADGTKVLRKMEDSKWTGR